MSQTCQKQTSSRGSIHVSYGPASNSHLPFSPSKTLRDFAGFVDEKLRDGAERAARVICV